MNLQDSSKTDYCPLCNQKLISHGNKIEKAYYCNNHHYCYYHFPSDSDKHCLIKLNDNLLLRCSNYTNSYTIIRNVYLFKYHLNDTLIKSDNNINIDVAKFLDKSNNINHLIAKINKLLILT